MVSILDNHQKEKWRKLLNRLQEKPNLPGSLANIVLETLPATLTLQKGQGWGQASDD